MGLGRGPRNFRPVGPVGAAKCSLRDGPRRYRFLCEVLLPALSLPSMSSRSIRGVKWPAHQGLDGTCSAEEPRAKLKHASG